MIYQQIGGVLRSFRKRNRLSMQDVADRLGVTKMAISHWENGDRRIGIDSLRSYCNMIGCTLPDILVYTGIDDEEFEMMSEEKEERAEWQILVENEDGSSAFIECKSMADAMAYFRRMEDAGLLDGADMSSAARSLR